MAWLLKLGPPSCVDKGKTRVEYWTFACVCLYGSHCENQYTFLTIALRTFLQSKDILAGPHSENGV